MLVIIVESAWRVDAHDGFAIGPFASLDEAENWVKNNLEELRRNWGAWHIRFLSSNLPT